MARQFIILLAGLFALASPAAGQSPRDQQWQYFETNGSGQPIPTAIFLSWDYSHVLFVSTCDAATATLKLRHPAYWPLVTHVDPVDGSPRYATTLPLALVRGELRIDGLTHLENAGSELVATFAVSPGLLSLLSPDAENELMIDVENETGDPWFAGSAEPLHRLAVQCVADR